MSFVHLHLHSAYSLLDGFSDIKKLMTRVKEMGMPAVALTDHGTMFGSVEFYNAATKAGIKPIIGLEAYMAARHMDERDSKLDKHSSHLLLLAQNETGYRNLLAIASAAQLNGFYYFPRIDHDFLASHAEGLIATSGCMAAEVPRAIVNEGLDAARRKLDWYYDIFGKDNFFLELQQHDIKELPGINRALMELGPRYEAKYIATNDVHYINPEDARLQDILLAIQTGALLSDANRFRMSDQSYYLRTPQEMSRLFAEVPEALSNTLLIAERCNVDLSFKGYHLPEFEVPEGFTTQSYLRHLCEQGLETRYGPRASEAVVRERLEYELGVIHQMGFDAYFLIVWDLCRQAREEGIWYNARGSASGSMVAYSLQITLVEPLSHHLIFERFLNPGRISMPDIDMDFPDDKRAHMMEYTANKYGKDKVAQIITFGTLGARAALRDVGRVMDIPIPEVDRVAKLVPNIPGKPVSIADALNDVAELQLIYSDPEKPHIKQLIDTASKMEGAVRNAGTHAAGVVITDRPVIDYVPLHRPTSGAEDNPIKIVTQFEMSIIESLGLLKVDFLGLATLTIMQRACDLIRRRQGVDLTLNNIPVDDPATFEFIGRGHTAGVFQLEGTGMTRYITQMKPKNLANVIAMVALYRPGPLEFIPKYIARMHEEEAVEYRHSSLQPIFEETFGIAIYQEQIMRAAVELAGYTLSEADDLRKAIAKKQKDKMEKHRDKFIQGAVGRGVMDQPTAEAIFNDWEEFARYGFPKAHAADYGQIAVQTAYLKAHYTIEYMTALLSASKNETEKIALYVADARSMGIDVLPPDIATSGWDFSIEDREGQKPAIRFGMGAIKNVGNAPVELITTACQEAPFRDLTDFANRVDLRQVGRRSLECLVKVGALDKFGTRSALLEALDRIIAVSTSHFRALQSGQMSLFGGDSGVSEEIALPPGAPLDKRDQLNWERELMGLYITDHPLGPYVNEIRRRVTHLSGQLADAQNKDKVVVAGMVSKFRPHQTKDGKSMGFATLEDIHGNIELVLFPRTWDQYMHLIVVDTVLVVEGKLDNAVGDPKVLVDRMMPLSLDDLSADSQPGADIQPLPAQNNSARVDAGFIPDDDWNGNGEEENGGRMIAEKTPSAGGWGEPTADKKPTPRPAVDEPDEWSDQGMPPPPPDFDDLDWMNPSGDWASTTPTVVKAAAEQTSGGEPVKAALQVEEEPSTQRSLAVTPGASTVVSEVTPTSGSTSPVGGLPFVMSPALKTKPMAQPESDTIRMVTITVRSTGDKARDVRRLRHIHGLLTSSPGNDKFSFHIQEGDRLFSLEFPNNTTGLTTEMIEQLVRLLGEDNMRVEMIRIQ